MGFFSKFTKSAKKVQNKDMLQAIVGAALMIAAADGEIEPNETTKLEEIMAAHDALSAFKRSEISAILQDYTKKLKANFALGKTQLMREISDIADKSDQAEEVLLIAVAIAEADGEIEDNEKKVIGEIAKTLRLNADTYLNAA
jgi:tellurite resistance protein TerB